MSLGAPALAWTLAAPLLVGMGVLRAIGVRFADDRLAYGGWAWLAGTFVTGAVVFAWLWSGPDVAHPLVPGGVLAGIALGGRWLGRRRAPAARPRAAEATPGWERALFAVATLGVLLVTAARILLATLRPVLDDDEAHFWALKAKMLFEGGGFGQAFRAMATAPDALYNADYPLLNPLLQVWTFVNAGHVVHVANRLPVQLFALALVLVLASALRRVVRPGVAAAILVVFASANEFAQQAGRAHGDLMVALGATVAYDAWLRLRAGGEAAWRRLAWLGLAFLAWSKNEGLLFGVALVLAGALSLVVRPRAARTVRPRRALGALLPLGVIALTWSVNRTYGFENGFVAGAGRDATLVGLILEQFRERAPTVMGYFWREIVLEPSHSGRLLCAFLALGLLFPLRIARSDLGLPFWTILLVLVGLMLVFVGAPHDLAWHLGTAARRVAFQGVPAACLWIGAMAGTLHERLVP